MCQNVVRSGVLVASTGTNVEPTDTLLQANVCVCVCVWLLVNMHSVSAGAERMTHTVSPTEPQQQGAPRLENERTLLSRSNYSSWFTYNVYVIRVINVCLNDLKIIYYPSGTNLYFL